MDFLGIGPTEILLIVLIAFVVLGPDRIPGVMRQLGKWLRQAREMTNNLTRDYGSDIKTLTGEITALQDEIRGIQRELGQFSADVLTGFTPQATTPPADGSLLPPLPQQGPLPQSDLPSAPPSAAARPALDDSPRGGPAAGGPAASGPAAGADSYSI
jgi:sec-independent protein translocase protein TatB